jgi:methylmalonyl-CoA mutase cobalamin-binding domain/chain
MTTHRQRILQVMRGEMVDVIPFVPRLDLWWMANALGGTLPESFRTMSHDDIARAEGWALYRMVPDFVNMIRGPEDILHRAIGLFSFQQSLYRWRFSGDIEVKYRDVDGQQLIEYHTPLGMVYTAGGLTEAMKRAGASLGWTQAHIIQKPTDYRIVAYIFENLEVFPNYEGFLAYQAQTGEDGIVAAGGPSLAASPMHHIQKEFLGHTRFFYEYKDHEREMRDLADSVAIYFDKVLKIIEESPAELVLWGANYDDTITYAPFFAREIQPWLRKVGERLGARGKLVATHTDGENFGLMDLIRDSGVHIAEAITPYPMTRVTIGEYYRRWRDKLILFGGIPECLLLEESTSDEEFQSYLDDLFRTVAPGDRLVLGIADSIPPHAVFDRVRRIGERIAREGRLPLEAGTFRPLSEGDLKPAAAVSAPLAGAERFATLRELMITGDGDILSDRIRELLEGGTLPQQILDEGLIAAMIIISEQFRSGEIFIPEVLLAARAMNEGLAVLNPHLRKDSADRQGQVLIGTVAGDLHDIGKNLVAIMLGGVGFAVRDLGINVAAEEFLKQVEANPPDILALSALLTTTMPEMKKIIGLLDERGLRGNVQVMVGGAPVNAKFARDIGADGYAPNATEAVNLAKQLLKS